jgi:hypothetical protein
MKVPKILIGQACSCEDFDGMRGWALIEDES